MEQRVWFRLKWVRQTAMIDSHGLLNISSSSRYDKLQYSLFGAKAVLIDADTRSNGTEEPPTIQVFLDPRKQIDGAAIVTFRLASSADVGPWVLALSR